MARNSKTPEAKENMRLKTFQKENSCENLTHGNTAHPRQSGEKSLCSSEMTTTLHFILVVMPYFMFCVATAVALRPLPFL